MPVSTGIRKAAVVLASLPPDEARALLTRLTPGEAAAIRGQMADRLSIGEAERRSAIREFARRSPPHGFPSPQKAAPTAVVGHPPFGFLANADAQSLTAALADEHPQTIAAILSTLPGSRCAQVVLRLSAELRHAVLRRLATIGRLQPMAVQDVARALAERIAQPHAADRRSA